MPLNLEAGRSGSSESGVGQVRSGTFMGLAAYFIWCSFPLYFKAISHVNPVEVLAHRIIWSAIFLFTFVIIAGTGKQLRSLFTSRQSLFILMATALLVSTNWLTFIYAVTADKVLDSSLGYYINPLVSILLARIFLGERLSVRQKTSIALAVTGVAVQTVTVGQLPVISLILAFTFGIYGLVRKAARVPAVTGLAVETTMLSPLALVYLFWIWSSGSISFLAVGTGTNVLLSLAGVITATPLILYGGALNRVRLSTMGMMQYIVPTGHFLLAVLAFGEPLTSGHMISFGFIWTALILYSSESIGISRVVTQAMYR